VPHDVEGFLRVERQFQWLSPAIANALYTVGGILLTLATPGLPKWVRGAMWTTWAAGVAMTVAAILDSVPGIVGSTVVLFPPLLAFTAWMGARWRPA
jgi:hypothetical protein